jgi:hypothetical protein
MIATNNFKTNKKMNQLKKKSGARRGGKIKHTKTQRKDIRIN